MALFEYPRPARHPNETGGMERVAFDVKISSLSLAHTAIRRMYMWCRRQPRGNTLVANGQRVADHEEPTFEVLRQRALTTPLYFPPPSGMFG